MFKASDGKQFSHDGMGKSYQGALDGGKGGLKPSMKPEGEQHGEQEAHEAVAEHGPAHTTQIAKKGDSHSVTSHHEDGHKHVSHGHDIESAHKHSMAMHGHDEDQQQQGDNENPEIGSDNPETDASPMGM